MAYLPTKKQQKEKPPFRGLSFLFSMHHEG
jgi:hypothetical protein